MFTDIYIDTDDNSEITEIALLTCNSWKELTGHEYDLYNNVLKFFIDNNNACHIFDTDPESAMENAIEHLNIENDEDSAFIFGLINNETFIYGMRLIFRFAVNSSYPMELVECRDMSMYASPIDSMENEEIHQFGWE